MRRFKNILVATHGQTEDKALIQRAALLAERNNAELRVLGVATDLSPPQSIAVPIKKLREYALNALKLSLDKLLAGIEKSKVSYTVHTTSGLYFSSILEYAEEHSCDVIMKTADTIGLGEHSIFKSTDLHLLRRSHIPVWLFRHPYSGYNRILAAIDIGDDDAITCNLNSKILEIADTLAKREDAELHIVHAQSSLNSESARQAIEALCDDSIEKVIEDENKLLNEECSRTIASINLSSGEPSIHIEHGCPEDIIPAMASRLSADIVVMGTLAKKGLEGLIIGNTAEDIINQIKCSLFTVKPDKELLDK